MGNHGTGTAGKYCKAKGTTLQKVSEATKQSRTTLRNWFYHKPELFVTVVRGVVCV